MFDQTPVPGSALRPRPHQPPPPHAPLLMRGLPYGQILVRELPQPPMKLSAAVHSPSLMVSALVRLAVRLLARLNAVGTWHCRLHPLHTCFIHPRPALPAPAAPAPPPVHYAQMQMHVCVERCAKAVDKQHPAAAGRCRPACARSRCRMLHFAHLDPRHSFQAVRIMGTP